MKERADVLLHNKNLAPSREKAKKMIMAGEVFIGTERIEKPGQMIDVSEEIRVKGHSLKYVSRGGFKLEKIIQMHRIDLNGKVCMDIGSSTGGFTDCMLQNGAKKVYAVDVGYNQLDYQLRTDPRVVVMERTNIRHLPKEAVPDAVDFVSIDVSFISLELVLPRAVLFLKEDAKIAALIKPQFEAGKEKVGKGGIVTDPKVHREVLEKIVQLVSDCGMYIESLTHSPIQGSSGNTEFLMLLSADPRAETAADIDSVIRASWEEFR
ncbi:23S rRNA (cytidine1920-2'-O)/16S rRNA (cytidine1409-2'-O)-methyltransferase [Peptoniphilus ivorii]|uniref:TlyA family RNA methyltransferase n=1 Tax=Aedoeadaptatus ivorii TaxID=54006 RepID=UPI0027830C62|nr:TlyA family RNA methyltransferase [Peptoniphilus ivorii]MDQ0507752.1 23S rRNA (cytidine1920-2'-O)/16S rRNA (cytidine1409-2'-O)-methyltransferase [Peptoniphilus ivorii]